MKNLRLAAAAALVSVAASSVGHAAVRPEVASMRTAPVASMVATRTGAAVGGVSEARGRGSKLLVPLLGGIVVVVAIIIAVSGGRSSPR